MGGLYQENVPYHQYREGQGDQQEFAQGFQQIRIFAGYFEKELLTLPDAGVKPEKEPRQEENKYEKSIVAHGKAPGHRAGKDQWLVQQP